ncbi:MAG: hypothetical protein AAF557_19235 [Pseudomonadota bacterium]
MALVVFAHSAVYAGQFGQVGKLPYTLRGLSAVSESLKASPKIISVPVNVSTAPILVPATLSAFSVETTVTNLFAKTVKPASEAPESLPLGRMETGSE